MTRLQGRDCQFKAQITAIMTLIFVLILSVVGALIESASIQITRNRKRADTLLALESTFAEYHPELLEEYDVFARYGCSPDILNQRMFYYGAKNIEHSIKKMQLLTDYNGAPFYQQTVRYMKDWLGIDELPSDSEYDFSEENELEEEEYLNLLELESMLGEEGVQLPEEDNPLDTVENLKKSPLLSILVSDQEALSNRCVHLEKLPSGRTLKKGNYAESEDSGTVDKVYFIAYIMEHFSHMTNQDEDAALLYELEYLLVGASEDQENLKQACEKIIQVRLASNYTYLMTDSARQSEAETMATSLSLLVGMPYLKDVLKIALVFAWAYGESIVDVRSLLDNKKVPFMKTDESWQLQLSSLISLGLLDGKEDNKETENGLSYANYLEGLLLLEDKETLSMRCLDLVECNLGIKTDQCVTRVEIKSSFRLRRGIEDTFTTSYGYQ